MILILRDHTNSKHRLLIYKFTTLAVSVLYKNTIHICCWSVLDKFWRKPPKILYIYTDLVIETEEMDNLHL